MSWLDEIKEYVAYDEQEKKDKEELISFCLKNEDVLLRDNTKGHISSSGFIVNPARDKVLMVYHLIYNTYAWTGGHVDGDEDFAWVARKETMEETGVKELKQLSGIISIDNLLVPTHMKNGKEVDEHYHFNVTYLFEVDENQPLTVKEDENSAVSWIPIDEIESWVEEKSMHRIYRKIIQRLIELKSTTKSDMINKRGEDV